MRHGKDVLDSHAVLSAAVWPTLLTAVMGIASSKDPMRTKTAAPVDPRLMVPGTSPTERISYETNSVVLFAICPTVMAVRSDALTPGALKQCREESDTHMLICAAEIPSRTCGEFSAPVNLRPLSTIWAEPVDGLFATSDDEARTPSYDMPSVRVCTRLTPAVTAVRRLPKAPVEMPHCSDVADNQRVDSAEDLPTRTACEYAKLPSEAPNTVTARKLLTAVFAMPCADMVGTSNVMSCVAVPTDLDEETACRAVSRSPIALLHFTKLSETQEVLSHDVCDVRTAAEAAQIPNIAP
eukprot:3549142-Rhodomonas_salina.3